MIPLFIKEKYYILGIFSSLLSIYIFTMSSTVTMEDSGEFLAAAHSMGILHPPGYPLYTILAKMFTFLPIGNVAIKIHFMNALIGAFTCVLLYFIMLLLVKDRLTALVTSICYGFSNTFWWQSIVAEVYTLNSMFFLLIFLLCLLMSDKFNLKKAMTIFFITGLGLSHHWPLLILASGAFIIILKDQWKPILLNSHKLIGFFLLGLLPYCYLYFRGIQDPYIAFTPIKDIEDLYIHIARKNYVNVDYQETASIIDKLKFMLFFITNLVREFWFIAFGLFVTGFIYSFIKENILKKMALLMAFISSSFLFFLFVSFDFDYIRKEIYIAYQLIPHSIVAIYIGYGFYFFVNQIGMPGLKKIISIGAAVILISSVFISNFEKNNMREETFAYDYARSILEVLPPNAILFINGDTIIGPMLYTNVVEGVRKDVFLYHEDGLVFNNRFFVKRKTSREVGLSLLRNFIQGNENIYALTPGKTLKKLDTVPFHQNGFFVQYGVDYKSIDLEEDSVKAARNFLEKINLKEGPQKWKYHRDQAIQLFCYILIRNNIEHEIFNEHQYCKYSYAHKLIKDEKLTEGLALLEDIMDNTDLYLKKSNFENIYFIYLVSRLKVLNQIKGTSKKHLYKELVDKVYPAIDVYPKCENRVLISVLQINKQLDNIQLPLKQLEEKFSHCDKLKNFF